MLGCVRGSSEGKCAYFKSWVITINAIIRGTNGLNTISNGFVFPIVILLCGIIFYQIKETKKKGELK